MFNQRSINSDILKKRAFNLRWATVPEGVIPLTAADPDFPCAMEISEAIAGFANDRYFCYGPVEGMREFKESMAGYFINKRQIAAQPALILPVDSAAFGIYITCKAFLAKDDEAIIFDPVDFLFRYSVEAVGGIAVPFAIASGENNIDFDRFEKMITKRTRIICLCNPLNPTGKVFNRAELLRFGEIACKHNLLILSDEIWSDIIFKPNHFVSIASLNDEIRLRTITITGFSKSYGLAGLRIGAVMASTAAQFERLMEASLHRSTIHGANVISQVAATAALDKCEYWLNDFIFHLQAMRDFLVEELNTVKGFNCLPPQGCYVAFVDITGTGKSNLEIQQILMEQARVSVVPGLKEWFGNGANGYIRLSFATSEEILKEAVSRIKNTINAL